MELALIFAIGWVASHAFGEKRDEYEHSQDAHRDKYMRRLADKHPNWSQARRARYLQNAARRNSLGHFAYLLRHGWSSTFNDFAHGWNKAKDAHEEWKAGRPEKAKKPGLFATLKAGWKDQAARRPKATGYYEPRPDLTPGPEPTPDPPKGGGGHEKTNTPPAQPSPPVEAPAGAKVLPLTGKTTKTPGNVTGSTNRSTAVTEFNFDASKAIANNIAQTTLGFASQLEQVQADAMANGNLTADTEAMKILASMQEALRNVAAFSNAYIENANKHSSGQEYANTGHAANTDYLRSS